MDRSAIFSFRMKFFGAIPKRSDGSISCGTAAKTAPVAADPPIGSMGSSDGSTSQLVQTMAGFGGGSGAAEGLNTVPLGADTSQQTLLTTPQHA